VRVLSLLGEGGQGSVFEVADVATGERAALKWYHPHNSSVSQRQAIELLLERGAPSESFLWPTALVAQPDQPGFGYLMPLRPDEFVGLSDLLAGRVEMTFSGVSTLCLELAHSFLLLHSEGLCYRDISFGNVFFEPSAGRILICDCDNVGVDGRSESMVLGTRRFMAPEIVRGEARPSTRTDLYSLAVLLFYVLMVGHPLLGRRELDFPAHDVDRAEKELLGTNPLFIFDPDDDSNAPVPDLHGPVSDNWQLYPIAIKTLFTRAFTTGLRDPRNGRVRESVWRRALVQLHDSIAQCRSCGRQNFFDPTRPGLACWACRAPIGTPLRLVFNDAVVVLNEATRLRGHHLRHDYDLTTVVAEVTRHPQQRDRWGLRNRSPVDWAVALPSGERLSVASGRTVGLVPGTRIDFGGRVAALEH
jgi:serine/threonine protein kinase